MTQLVHFYDACNPDNLPAGGSVYAAYLDGGCQNYAAVKARFPHAKIITITTGVDPAADVLDCERGNATPAQAAQWARVRHVHGLPASIYTSLNEWPVVKAACEQAEIGLAERVQWWIADWDGNPDIPEGAVAKQFGHPGLPLPSNAGYDESICDVDSWAVFPPPPKPVGPINPGSFADKTPVKSRPKTFPKSLWLWNPMRCTGDVKFLRLCLNQCPIDKVPHFKHPSLGGFGPKTHNAVMDFQRWQNLPVDGIVSPRVWQRLGLNPPRA